MKTQIVYLVNNIYAHQMLVNTFRGTSQITNFVLFNRCEKFSLATSNVYIVVTFGFAKRNLYSQFIALLETVNLFSKPLNCFE